MKYFIVILWIVILLSLLVPAYKAIYVRAETTEDIVYKYAFQYGVPANKMLATMRCESQLNPNAIASTNKEYSVGISQINLKVHKDVTEAQAKDISFASNYMAKEFSKHHEKMWTCWKG